MEYLYVRERERERERERHTSRRKFYNEKFHNSNVRHPRCVLYNSKELGMLTLTVEHNYICFYYRSLQQRHVSALHVGHHRVVVRLTA